MIGYSLEFAAAPFLLFLALVPGVYLLSRRSLSGLGGGRLVTAICLRSLALTCVVFALARMRILKTNDRLCVLFVVDDSDSVPAAYRKVVLEHIQEVQAQRDEVGGDLVGVVIFGRDAGVEVSPSIESLAIENFATLIHPESTNVQEAIQLAVTAFPEDAGGKRIVLFTDGNENIGHALDEIRNARSLGVTVDVVPIVYDYSAEISVDKVIVDPDVLVGQPFTVQVVVLSTAEVDVRLRLFENGLLLPQADDVRQLKPGKNFFQFKGLRREMPGRFSYEVQVEPLRSDDDVVVQNNVAHGFTMIHGEPKVLLCAGEPELDGALVAALRAERIRVDIVEPDALPRSPEDYFAYSAIVLSNVGAHQITGRMEMLEGLVKGLGVGFVMIGGEESFGAGGYQGSPVERILPVDMDLKHKKILPNGALAFVMHSCELDGGRGNDWGRQVVQQAIRILSPRDYAGVVYYDPRGSNRWLFPMTPCSRKHWMFSQLTGFNPGDMPSFQPIMQKALAGLSAAPASIKHMIVFSDGDPSPASPGLLDQIINQQRISISTVCYGYHNRAGDLANMKRLAELGGGNSYVLRSPSQLPEIFIREATTVRKALISEDAFFPLLSQWGPILQGLDPATFPTLDGYVLTTAKPLANLLLVHPPLEDDPTLDPVLATWQVGVGRSVAFTSDAGRRWGQPWVAWSGYQRFWGQLVRWVSRPQRDERFRVTRQIVGEEAKITVDALTETGEFIDGLHIKGSVMTPGPDFETRDVALRQVAPGRYEATFPAGSKGTYGLHLESQRDGERTTYTTGISVPYSAEYRQLSTNHVLLRQIADASGGRLAGPEQPAIPYFSRDFVSASTVQDVWRELLFWAMVFFFADVFVRRVMIDYRALGHKLVLAVAAVRGRRAAPTAADARLASLLEAKARARKTADIPPERGAESAPEGTAPVSFDASYDAGAAATSGTVSKEAASSAPSPAAGDASPPADDASASYTGRLLKAKRRALNRDETDEKKD